MCLTSNFHRPLKQSNHKLYRLMKPTACTVMWKHADKMSPFINLRDVWWE